MKPRLLLTSTLFLFAQMATMQAQETLDIAKITCEQFAMEQLASPSHDVVLWLRQTARGVQRGCPQLRRPQAVRRQ